MTTTDTTTDPLLGFSPDEIVVGATGQTLAQAAAAEAEDEAATHARDLANCRAADAERVAAGLEPLHSEYAPLDPIAHAAAVLRRPQHPEHLAQASALLEVLGSLDELWARYVAAGHVPEVWAIAALAWHIAQPNGGAAARAKRDGVI